MNILRQVRSLLTHALLPAVAAMALLGLAPAVQGQTIIYKTNNSTNGLTSTSAWSNSTAGAGGAPTAVNAADEGIIDSTVSLANAAALTYSSNLTLGALQIGNSTSGNPLGPVTINGTTNVASTNTFFLGNSTFSWGGGIDMSNATQALTLGANVTLSLQDNQQWTVGNGTSHPGLTINGPMVNPYSLNITGNTPVTFAGVISGLGPLGLNTSNTTTLSGANTLTGNINLFNGTLVITNSGTASASSLGGPTNVLGIYGASSLNTSAGAAVTIATNNNVQLDNNLTFIGSNNLNLGTGVVTLGNSNVTISVTANTFTLGGTIVDGGALNYSNANSITKTGAGTLVLGGNNIFSGNFNMQAGIVNLTTNLSLQNATLDYTGGTINWGQTNAIIAGLAGSTNLALPTANLSIVTSPFENPGYSSPFGSANYTGVLSGSGSSINISGLGTQIFSGANTYTGGTNLSGGTLVLNNVGSAGTSSAIGTGALNITGGTLDAGAAMSSAISTHNTLTFGGSFTFAGSNSLNMGTGNVTLSATPTITVNANTLTLGGTISGAQGLTLNGSGTLALTNASSNYTGATTINGGTLSVTTLALGTAVSSIGNSTSAQANLIINGGTLQFLGASAQTTDRRMTVGANGATFDSSGTAAGNSITFSNTSAVVYSTTGFNPVITFTGTNGTAAAPNSFNLTIGDNGGNKTSIIKSGAGLWNMNATNTYTGGTTLNAGTLEIQNASALGSGIFTITGGNFDNANASVTTLTSENAMNWNGNWTYLGTNSLNISSTLATNTTGSQTYTAASAGAGDNGVTITYTVGGASTSVTSVVGNAVTVNLKTGGDTEANIAAAISGNVSASALVAVSGSGSVTTASTVTLSGGVSAGAVTLGNNVTLTVSNTNALTIGGAIGDGAQGYSLTKTGTGNLVLTGVNTFSGNLNLQQGTLTVGNSLALQNATLNFTTGTLGYGAGVTNFTVGGLVGNQPLTLPSANLTINTSNVTPTSNGGAAPSEYTFANLTYTGVISGTGSSVLMNGNGTEVFSGLNTYTGGTTLNSGTLDLNINGTATTNSAVGTGTITFNGGNIDNSSGGNITLGGGTGTNNAISIKNNFTFEGTNNLNLGTGAVTLNSSGTAYQITVAGHTLTIGGAITGSTDSIVLQGSTASNFGGGTLVLSNGTSTYSGGTTLNAGWLDIGSSTSSGTASAIGTGALSMNGGNIDNTSGSAFTLGTNNSQVWENNFTFAGSNSLNMGTGAVTLSFSPVISITANTFTANGTVSGVSSLTLNGQGTLLLGNASNSYTLATNINGGTLSVTKLALGGSNSGIGASSNAAANLTFNGGTLQFISSTATQTTDRNFTIYSNGATIDASSATAADTVNFSGTGVTVGESTTNTSLTLTGNSGSAATFNILSPVLADNGSAKLSVIKNGTGEWSLNATNTYTGGTFLNAGTLGVGQAAGLGNGPLTITGGNLDNTNGSLTTLSNHILQNWNGSWAFVGSNNLNMGTGTVTLNAPVTLTVTANTVTVGGQITDNGIGYTFTKAGTGTLNLTSNISLQNSTLNISGGVVSFASNNATLGGLAGATALTAPANLTLNTSFFFNNNYSGALSGASGPAALTINGSGIQELSGTNTYTGTTTLNGGTLELGSAAALGTSTLNINSTGVALDASGVSITNPLTLTKNFTYLGVLGSLTQGTGAITLAQANETINVAANTVTLGGVISGSGNILTKAGPGTLVLTGFNLYTGGTVVDGGTLKLDFSGLAANSNNITPNNRALTLQGGTLALTGNAGATRTNTQTYSATTIGAGASTLSETMSSGTMTVNLTGLTRSAGGTLDVNQDAVAANSSVTSSTATTTSGVMTSGGVAYVTFSTSTSSLLAGTDWGNINATKIVAATSTSNGANSTWASTLNAVETANAITMNLTGGTHEALNSLVFAGGAGSINLNTGTLTVTTGGILESSNSTGADTISGGNLTSGSSELVIVLNNSTAADGLSISGNIVGAIALTKSGLGNLSLTGTGSTFSGSIYLNAGTLTFNNANALGTTANTLEFNGGSLDAGAASLTMARPENWNNNWTFVGSNDLILSNTTTMSSNIALTTTAKTLTVSGAISGGFSLTKKGTGNLTLNGTNTFTGGLNLTAGTLNINSAAALGATGSTLTINGGNIDNTNATLTVTNNNAQIWSQGFSFLATNDLNMGTGAVALGANDTVIVNAAKTLTIGGNIGGSTTSGAASNTLASQFSLTLGNLTAGSTGALALFGNNSYNGGTTVTNGTLTLGNATGGFNIGTGNTTINTNGTLNLNQGGNATASALGTGTFIANGGVLNNTSGSTVTIGTNNAIALNASLTFTGSNSLNLGTGAVTLSVSPTITVSGSTLTLGGVVSGAFGITKGGSGTLVLGGNNTYSGATTVSLGTLELSGNGALGINALGTTVASGATLQLDSNYNTGSGNSSSTGSLLTITGAGNGTANGGELLNGAGNSIWNGNIVLGGSATISSGAGTGCITIGNTTALFSTAAYGNLSNISIGSNTLTFTGAAGSATRVAANITGNGGQVVVNTAGTVTYYTPTNSYTGLTTVQNGTLILNTQSNGSNTTAGQGNLSILGNLVIGTGTNTAVVQENFNREISDQTQVTINQNGELNTNGNQQLIANLTMNGGDIETSLSGIGLLATNGNSSITIAGNANTSTINGNFSMGGSVGTTITPINITRGANATSDFTINALLTGGSFIQTGNGIMTLNNQVVGAGNINAFTGSAEIAGGTLVITASNALGANNNLAGEGTQVDAGAQLQINQTTATAVAVPGELLTLNGQGTGGSDGALRNVNGTNSWAGNVLVNTNATINTAGASTLTFSGCISSSTNATLTFNGTGNTTISGTLAGNVNLYQNMNTGSTLFITNTTANTTFTGATTVNNGTLELKGNTTTGGTNLIGNGTTQTLTINTHGTLLTDTNETLGAVNMVLNGGTWETNAVGAAGTGLTAFSSNNGATAQSKFTDTLNTLTLTANSNITLGSNANIINFAASNAANWTPGQILYINNWVGVAATSYTSDFSQGLSGGNGTDQIYFGTTNAGLDGTAFTGQMGEIIFVNPQDASHSLSGLSGNFHAIIESNGEIVPFVAAPEPGTMAAGAALGALALLREWRRRKDRAAKKVA